MTAEKSEEYIKHSLGMDTIRHWATECQFHQSGPLMLFVFRETAAMTVVDEDGSERLDQFSQNVTSVLMTAENAKALGQVLTKHFADEEADGERPE